VDNLLKIWKFRTVTLLLDVSSHMYISSFVFFFYKLKVFLMGFTRVKNTYCPCNKTHENKIFFPIPSIYLHIA